MILKRLKSKRLWVSLIFALSAVMQLELASTFAAEIPSRAKLKELRIFWTENASKDQPMSSAQILKNVHSRLKELSAKSEVEEGSEPIQSNHGISMLWIQDARWLSQAELGLSKIIGKPLKSALVDGDTGMRVTHVIVFVLNDHSELILALNAQGNFRWVNIVAPLPEIEHIRFIMSAMPNLHAPIPERPSGTEPQR